MACPGSFMIDCLVARRRIWLWRVNLCADRNRTRNTCNGAEAKAEPRLGGASGIRPFGQGPGRGYARRRVAFKRMDPSSALPLADLPIESLQRGAYQPRRDFEQEALETLADSIRAQGVLQPVVARPLEAGRFEILSGERRWRAAQIAGPRPHSGRG